MRTCTKCGTAKPLDCFSPERRTRTGYQSQCKACRSAAGCETAQRKRIAGIQRQDPEKKRAADRAYYAANRERRKGYIAEWQRANPDKVQANRTKNDTDRRSKRKRRDRIRETDRAWRSANRDKVNAYWRDRHAKFPELMVTKTMKRHARKMNAPGRGVTADEWVAIVACFGNRCAYCLARAEALEMDHVEPLARGGAHEPENVVPACTACNSSKKARTLFACFARSLVIGQRMANHFSDAA